MLETISSTGFALHTTEKRGNNENLSPDWVCEVLSPSTASTDRAVKMPIYAQYGVGYLWLIDPLLKTLEAYELVAGRWSLLTTLKDEDQVRVPPFDALGFSLADLW